MHAVKVWMLDTQLGRRNLMEGEARDLRGVRDEMEKQGHGGQVPGSRPQNEASKRTATKLADQYRVRKAPDRAKSDASPSGRGYVTSLESTGRACGVLAHRWVSPVRQPVMGVLDAGHRSRTSLAY